MKDLREPVHFPYPLHLFKTLQNMFSFLRFAQVAPGKTDIHGASLTCDACEGVSTHHRSQATHLLSWHSAQEQRNTISTSSQVLNSLFQLHPSGQRYHSLGCSAVRHRGRTKSDNKQNLMSCLWIYRTIRSDGLSLCPDGKCTNWSWKVRST